MAPPRLYFYINDLSAPLGSFLNPYLSPPPSRTSPLAGKPVNLTPIKDPFTCEDLDADLKALSFSDDDSESLRREAWDRPHPLEGNPRLINRSHKQRFSFSDHVEVHGEQPATKGWGMCADSGDVFRRVPGQ